MGTGTSGVHPMALTWPSTATHRMAWKLLEPIDPTLGTSGQTAKTHRLPGRYWLANIQTHLFLYTFPRIAVPNTTQNLNLADYGNSFDGNIVQLWERWGGENEVWSFQRGKYHGWKFRGWNRLITSCQLDYMSISTLYYSSWGSFK